VKCPLKNGIYEKLNSKLNYFQQQHRSNLNEYALPLIAPASNEPCKYLTQTQTLQVGCQNEQQYSLRTKLCYPNHQYNGGKHQESITSQSNRPLYHQQTTNAYTQLESEINLVCLAHWKHNGNHVIVSRTMSNEILCSVCNNLIDQHILFLK
jgi:hypothetical protein